MELLLFALFLIAIFGIVSGVIVMCSTNKKYRCIGGIVLFVSLIVMFASGYGLKMFA